MKIGDKNGVYDKGDNNYIPPALKNENRGIYGDLKGIFFGGVDVRECEVRENCKNFLQNRCWYCEDYGLYWPENPRILSPRQVREREERRLRRKMQKQTEASKRGRRAKRKGYDGEHEIVQILRKYGIEAERVPLSGALGGKNYSGDIYIRDIDKRAEVKRRKSGLKTLYTWLRQNGETKYVFFRQDREDWLVVMPISEFIELVIT